MPSVTPAAFPTAGTVLTAAEYNKLPRGVLVYATVSANQTGITTETDVTSFTATWTATSTRLYRTSIYCASRQLTTASAQDFKITDASNVAKARYIVSIGAANDYNAVVFSVIETGLSGSTTRKLRAATSAGSISVLNADVSVGYILVEDLGAG